MKITSLIKNTVFVLWLGGALISATVGASIWAFQATVTAARLGAEITTTAVRHRKDIASAVMRVKAKARLKRMVTMIPFAGLAAGAYFEEQEYNEWLEDNPDSSRSDYLCALAGLTSEVLDEVLEGLPTAVRPNENTLNNMTPKCESTEG